MRCSPTHMAYENPPEQPPSLPIHPPLPSPSFLPSFPCVLRLPIGHALPPLPPLPVERVDRPAARLSHPVHGPEAPGPRRRRSASLLPWIRRAAMHASARREQGVAGSGSSAQHRAPGGEPQEARRLATCARRKVGPLANGRAGSCTTHRQQGAKSSLHWHKFGLIYP